MSQNPCGCEEDNCPHRTSEVNLWDGTFTNITVPSGAGLNEVLSLLENYITTINTCNDVNYTLTAFSACLNLPAGTYSFTQIMDAVIARVCANSGDITALQSEIGTLAVNNTTTTLLDGIIYPTCFASFVGTTSTELLNVILSNLCSLLTEVAPTTGDGGVIITAPDPGTQTDPNGTNAVKFLSNSRMEHIAESLKSFVDNKSYMYEHVSPIVSISSFTVRLNPMRGVVDYFLVIRTISEELTVNASRDTYFYLSGDSTILRRDVANGAPSPATPSGSATLYTIVSDGSGVTSITDTYNTQALTAIPLTPGSVGADEIANSAVTTAKIATVNAPLTVGHPSLLEVTSNMQGQVTSSASNMLLGGLANGQILTYNSGLNRFENTSNTNITPAGFIPMGDATGADYTPSSLFETASQVLVDKKVEINNTGLAALDDSHAILALVGGPVLMPRITATQASSLPLSDGYLVYVTDINLTFTSVGFWGVESGVWIKL